MNEDELRRVALTAKLDQSLPPVFASVEKLTKDVHTMLEDSSQDTSTTFTDLIASITKSATHYEACGLAAAALIKLAQVTS